jgi:hypothetical protein
LRTAATQLAEIAVAEPQGRYADVAGLHTHDLIDMARRTNTTRGREVKLVPTWSAMFDESTAGNVMLPGVGVRIASTTFDQSLATGGQ